MTTKFGLVLFAFVLLTAAGCKKDNLTVKSRADLEEKLQREFSDNNLTGVSYCVVKNDRILYSGAQGYADEANNKLATDTSRYLIASISKTITAVALMQLVEQNLIALDDDINNFLPYPVRNPDFPNTPITYRMLLSHTSSISDDFQNTLELDCYGTDCAMTLEQFFSSCICSQRAVLFQ
jgi:CubicO group peptidase (beta-lactamase class C family)